MNKLLDEEASTELSCLSDTFRQLKTAGFISDVNGGGLSYKETVTNLFGESIPSLFYFDVAQAAPAIVYLDQLRKLAQVTIPFPKEKERELTSSRINVDSSTPNEAALLHACVESPAAALITCEPILAVGCVKNWREKINSIWGNNIIALDYCEYGPEFYKEILTVSQTLNSKAIYLRYRGLLISADTPEQLFEHASRFVKEAIDIAGPVPSLADSTEPETHLRTKIAGYRQELSKTRGENILVCLKENLSASPWFRREACSEAQVKMLAHEKFDSSQPKSIKGNLIDARTAIELHQKIELIQSSFQIERDASKLGELELLHVPASSVETAQSSGPFTGEVALVTGAAMGIGKACVESLLARGAAVIALDIKPDIVGLFDTPAYLGLQCDLTNPTDTVECFEKGVRAFGGLDMLVLNAGIFPASCTLESMSMEYWRKVMDINLDVNITLLRESYPLLKCSPRHGRVVINASRNVPAPGPGAAAYSASKAALTQLGRVAALEWGPSHIRVNMLHPHAVFDTGIWTDEVITSRAAKYGLTVEQYKTNNVLGVELRSHDIGELVAEMLGPVFSKTTGAQIPVDGGCDRVI